ncbi:MAG: exodeoxyribonuclease III [Thiothrix sp.]|nr:MAG: exodeoxyribonuclease III [Thiothrix sp.]
MKIASWNVNSLKVRLPHVIDWLEANQPDVLVLQETKLQDENFPLEEINAAGYHVVFSGQKTYNGMALISKLPAENIVTDVPGLDDPQRRILGANVGNLRVLDLYVVNGQELESEKYDYKLDWLSKVTEFISKDLINNQNYIVLGDFNIIPEDADCYDSNVWHDRIFCSDPEREALQKIIQLGFKDSFRLFDQEDNTFSWWDYRQVAFRRNRGLRIDLILASNALAEICQSSFVDKKPRKLERPSDHAPVVAEFDFNL